MAREQVELEFMPDNLGAVIGTTDTVQHTSFIFEFDNDDTLVLQLKPHVLKDLIDYITDDHSL